MRRTATAVTAALLLTLTGCGNGGETSKAKPSPSTTPAPTPSYDFQDCKNLLEYDYQAGQPRDASNDPECAHLTDDQYAKAVGEVLAGHKDEIMDKAAREVIWDKGWDAIKPDAQDRVCAQIRHDGVEAAGQQFAEAGAEPVGYETEMAQYYLDNKC